MIVPDWAGYLMYKPAFDEVIDSALYPEGWLDFEILDGRARFWRNDTAAIVATIKEYPSGAKAVHGLIAAGDLEGITALIPLAEQWGRDEGCIYGEIESRPEWARVMKYAGYEPAQLMLRKGL